MICTVEVRCNAANPNLPIKQFVSFKGSPSSIRVLDVPKKIGEWNITNVYIQVKYPDDTTISKECVRNGSVWVGTVEGTNTTGTSRKGFSIIADGKDENGEVVEGYVLGVGDVVIMEFDGTISPNETTWSIHLYDSQPDNPKTGDAYLDGIALMVYDGNAWIKVGGQDLSGYVKIGNNNLGQNDKIVLARFNDSVELNANEIKVNGNKVLTENQVVPDSSHAGFAANATFASNAAMASYANGANKAIYADTASMSEQDGNGNNIATTYATKTYVDDSIGNVLTQEEF